MSQVTSETTTPPARVAVIGTGAWGTTLARLVALERMHLTQTSGNAHSSDATDVTLWEHRPERAEEMQRIRENRAYLPGFEFPPNLHVTSDLARAVESREIVLLVTPSQSVRETARRLAALLAPQAVVVCASKGLELGSRLRLSQVIEQEVSPSVTVAALSGPNLASEIARGLPAAAVVAAQRFTAAERARAALTASHFRIYTSHDVVGVEMGGALKNIVAIGIGVSDGLQYGDNARASLMTRALAEISRLAVAAGANPLTLAGLAGLGDLIATCTSPLSRNRTLGLELARGRTLDDVLAERKTVAEGVTTTRAALEAAKELKVELPITKEIAQVLFEGKSVREAVTSLMLRDPKNELEGL